MRLRSLLLVLGVLTAARLAPAEEDASVREATRLMREGKDLFSHRRYEEARVKLVAACAVVHSPACVQGLAMSELKAGRPLDALRHFDEVLGQARDADAGALEALRKMREDAYGKTGHLLIDTNEGAAVAVDGTPPLSNTVDVTPGRHAIDVTLGAKTAHTEVDAPAGAPTTVKMRVEVAPVVVVPAAASTPVGPPATSASTPVLPTSEAAPSATPFWSPRREIGAGIAGAGVAALVLGFYFGAEANSDANRIAQLSTAVGAMGCTGVPNAACSDLASAHGDQSRDHSLNVAFVTGGAIASAAGAVLLLWPASKGTPTMTLVPAVGRDVALLWICGELGR